jgi:hypothetical protein
MLRLYNSSLSLNVDAILMPQGSLQRRTFH